jgi:UDP-2-acetamido-3-amino-2,3-dideoxy-glucuronate N-acetyltransferase
MDKSVYIHPTAIVSEKCEIGNGTKVWVNSQIREDVKIGENCIISKDTYIDFGVKIGNNVKIQNGVSVYHGVTIEDNVFIGPNAAFTNDFYPRAFNVDWQVTETLIKEGASIGANATIICGRSLGKYCMVGAGSVVTKDIQDFALVVGNPAHIIGYVCKCGEKLDSDYKCKTCGEIIKIQK